VQYLDTFEFSGNILTIRVGVLLCVFGESLLFRLVPGFVKASLDFVRKMLGPDSGERSQATRSLDVAYDTADDHGRSFDHCYSFDNFSLVHL